jgi:hypothetical protein
VVAAVVSVVVAAVVAAVVADVSLVVASLVVAAVVVVVASSASNLYIISFESFSFPSRIIYPCILFVNEKSKTVNDISNLRKFIFIFLLNCCSLL